MNTPVTPFKFGTVTVPDGQRGPWRINSFTLTEDDVMLANLRYIRDGNAYMRCPPGDYRRLTHKDRGVIMSNTPMEINTAREAIRDATGHVLVNGLGLGVVVEAMLHKPEVQSIIVVEIDEDVVKLVWPHICKVAKLTGKKVGIAVADAERFVLHDLIQLDYVWHDIWDQIDDDNLPQMTRLVRKYQRRAGKQGVWSREQARKLREQMRRDDRRWG